MLKRLCLRPSIKAIILIKGDESILILPVPMILPLKSSPKVTLPLSLDIDRIEKLLKSRVICRDQPLL